MCIRDSDRPGQVPAQAPADEHAAPAAEPQADVLAIAPVADQGRDALTVELERPLDQLAERVAILKQAPNGGSGDAQLGCEVPRFDRPGRADDPAADAASDLAGPVTQQVGEAFTVDLLEQPRERLLVAVLDRIRETLDELLVLGNLDQDLGEPGQLIDRYRLLRPGPGELQAEQHALLGAEPVGYPLTVGLQAELSEEALEGLAILAPKGVEGGPEDRLVFRDPAHRLAGSPEVVEQLLLVFQGHGTLLRCGCRRDRITLGCDRIVGPLRLRVKRISAMW